MEKFENVISRLESKHGRIDNIKFLVKDIDSDSIDMVIADFAQAAELYLEGTSVPATEYRDTGLSREPFDL